MTSVAGPALRIERRWLGESRRLPPAGRSVPTVRAPGGVIVVAPPRHMPKLLPMLALAAATACPSVDLQRPEQWVPQRQELQADLYECLQGSQKVYFVNG